MRKKMLLMVLLPPLLLQGCAALVVGGIATGGAAYMNRDALKTYYHDSNISYAINQRIRKEPSLQDNTHIVVAVYKGIVLLAGQVVNPAQRIKAEQLTAGIPGIQRVYNEITIAGPTSTLTRSSDAWITRRVESSMVLTKNLKSRDIRVITENGVVYLMGDVSPEQAQLAVHVARQISGVQRVVTLFNITS